MPSIAHKLPPVNCSVGNAFLCLFVTGAVLKDPNRILLPWTTSQNARRKNCCNGERGRTPVTHEQFTWILFVHSLNKTEAQVSTRREPPHVSRISAKYHILLKNEHAKFEC